MINFMIFVQVDEAFTMFGRLELEAGARVV